jgi:tetratricopeptide (TPR) repeat protein
MKSSIILFGLIFATNSLFAQNAVVFYKQAENADRKLNGTEAMDKYKEVLTIEPNNRKALLKLVELNCAMGDNEIKKDDKKKYYDSALNYANKLALLDSLNINGWYALFIAKNKLIETEVDRKNLLGLFRDTKLYADKALQLDSNSAIANYMQGKWQYDMVMFDWKKKIIVNTFTGKLPQADMDAGIDFLEKAKKQDMYFMPAYWVLANAYQQKNRPTQQTENLKMVLKLPVLSLSDNNIKTKAQQMLNENE